MVRKRTRSSKKHYESEEENDSDLDINLEEVSNTLAPKKYSLRQRKRPLFTEAFDDDFEDAEEIHQLIRKKHSDDEDFEVEREIVELQEAAKTLPKTPRPHHHVARKKTPKTENTEVTEDTYYEPPPEVEHQNEEVDGMIDFEDMIRADIVVNKNRIDYDNVICRSEIKVDPADENPYPKRKRKPRKRCEEEIDSSLLEPEMEMDEAEFDDDENDKDYNPADDLMLPSECLQTEIQESDAPIDAAVNGSTENGSTTEQTCLAIIDKFSVENDGPSLSEQIVTQTTEVPSVVPEEILEIDKRNLVEETQSDIPQKNEQQETDRKLEVPPVKSNGSLAAVAIQKTETIIDEVMIVEDSEEEAESDDDLIIIEPKYEVVVVDD
ncbi:unnamed protein product [Acanthoscelides obtectus]|uniref:Uncharacterized protein n=1 Tax=Acanthoscelides obtectus TaxID=200917 RepID=A0A9P0LCV2_ACAOB|nr:unnamed protein product [Acanthoscelides obtectus]CAK1658974.1 hypothetical protein AOBTE_LOCUS21218 [Acanthoscelides obtectus]